MPSEESASGVPVNEDESTSIASQAVPPAVAPSLFMNDSGKGCFITVPVCFICHDLLLIWAYRVSLSFQTLFNSRNVLVAVL
jgi:hypothetical protein